jgi:glycosyltransferase involved in cell wall biosynthesis
MNRPDALREALVAVARCEPGPFEILVGDDSPDGSPTEQVVRDFPGVKYLRGPCRGLSANRNACIRKTTGSHLAFIDDDVLVPTEFFAKCHQLATGVSEREIITGIEWNYAQQHPTRVKPKNADFWGFQRLSANVEYRSIVINSTLFPRSLFSEAMFDDRLRYGCEEIDMARHAVSRGYRIRFDPELAVRHYPSPVNRATYSRYLSASRFYTTAKALLVYDKAPMKALAFTLLAPPKEMIAQARRNRITAALSVPRSVLLAFGYARRAAREPVERLLHTEEPGEAVTGKLAAKLSVIVPSYRRPDDLRRCLLALLRQKSLPAELIIVFRDTDSLTRGVLDREFAHAPIKRVPITHPGQVHALNCGLRTARGDVIAITDDDAAPRPDWLERIHDYFSKNPRVGAVGGRDWVYSPDGTLETGSERIVGKLRWYGSPIGNHHLGVGPAREVDVLKGTNMAYRRSAIEAIRFDHRLLGSGAQVRNDMAFSLAVRRAGWRVIYDPAVAVDHYPAPRTAGDTREFTPLVHFESTHNDTLVLLDYLRPCQRPVFICWAFIIGSRALPGLLQIPRLMMEGKKSVLLKWWATLRGRFAGTASYLRYKYAANPEPAPSAVPLASDEAASPPIPRVLFIDHTARLGGGELALLSMVRHLDRNRFDPAVVLFSDGPLRNKLELAGVPVMLLPLSAHVIDARKDGIGGATLMRLGSVWETLKFTWELRKLIRDSGAAIVHTNSLKSDIIGGLAARLAGKPLIWHVRDRIADDYLSAKVAAVFRFLCAHLPHHVIGNSAATLKTLGSLPPERTTVVYSGVEMAEVIESAQQTPAASEPVIALIGRLAPWKGQHIFLDAAAQVLKTFAGTKFQIIGSALFGEDEYERQLREQVKTLGIAHAVEFCGFCGDVPHRIGRLTMLVHASTTAEPFGQVVVQGMAAGKPVVATAGGGVAEIVEQGQSGLLVPMSDAAAMAVAIESLLANPQRAAAIGAAGRQRVLEKFTIQHTVDAVQNLYARMLAGKMHWHGQVPSFRERSLVANPAAGEIVACADGPELGASVS